jgi:2-polyprenyl-3-methyl-5-hydroxy-6-metoxy-1,4-benzoquinol methylase
VTDARYYWIPFAPVSWNHAYRNRAVRGRVLTYLDAPYARFKDWIVETLREQDAETAPPAWNTYRVEYLCLFREWELFSDGLPRGRVRRVRTSGPFQQRDVTNFLKLLEDALFAYLGADDSRVVENRISKLAVGALPGPVERYALDLFQPRRFGSGWVLIRVADGGGMLWRGPDARYQRFAPLLDSAPSFRFLARREHATMPDTPEWFAPPEDRLAVKADPLETWAGWRRAQTDPQRARVLQAALSERVVWIARLRDEAEDLAARRLLDWEHLRDEWRAIVGWHPAPSRRSAKLAAFDRCWGWAYHFLADEGRPRSLERFTTLYRLLPGKRRRILLVGAHAGTWVYPFVARGHHVTAVELDGAAVLDVLRARDREHRLRTEVVPVGTYAQLPDGRYDWVVCLDILDRVEDPLGLVAALSEVPAAGWVLSYTFRDRKGRGRAMTARQVQYPWVRTEIPGDARRPALLVQRALRAAGLRLARGDFGDDLLVLERKS